MDRTVEEWRQIIIREMTPAAIADYALKDLVGYREAHSYRSQDHKSLTNLLTAIVIEAVNVGKANAKDAT